MKIRTMNWFMKLIMPGITGICLFPFGIYYKTDTPKESTILHEKVHWEQQKEMLCIFFYPWYIIEWFIKLFFCGRKAYISISFEQEARAFTPENRMRYGWVRYIFRCCN